MPHQKGYDGTFAGFLSLNEVMDWATTMARVAPDYVHVHEIGRSWEDRPILAIELSFHDTDVGTTPNKPEVLFNALHHSREPLSMMTVLGFAQDIIDKLILNDKSALHLLTSRRVWIVPVVNPDGYEYNRENFPKGGGNQRKNRRPTCPSHPLQSGVDINRNYPFCFGRDSIGSSAKPCAEDYQGQSAGSEPETQAMQNFVLSRKPNLAVAFNYHSFGRQLYIPNACKGTDIADLDNKYLADFATGLSALNNYKWGRPWAMGLYQVNGDAGDWMFNAGGVDAVVSPEVAPQDPVPSDKYGFWPPQNKISPWVQESLKANYYGAWAAGPMLAIKLKSVKGETGSPAKIVVMNRGTRDTAGAPHIALLDGENKVVFNVMFDAGVLKGKSRSPRSWETGLSIVESGVRVAVWDDLDCAVFGVNVVKQVLADAEPNRMAANECRTLVGDISSTSTSFPVFITTHASISHAPTGLREGVEGTKTGLRGGFDPLSPPVLLFVAVLFGCLVFVQAQTNVFGWLMARCCVRKAGSGGGGGGGRKGKARTRSTGELEMMYATDSEDGDTDDEYGGGFGDEIELAGSPAARSAEYATLRRT